MTMLAVPHLIRTTGTIVNVSSVNGLRSVSNTECYGQSQHISKFDVYFLTSSQNVESVVNSTMSF